MDQARKIGPLTMAYIAAGIAFGGPGRALVRQEVHEWLPKVPQGRSEWAHSVFRVQQGVE